MANFDLLCLMILLVSTTPSLATTDSSFPYPLPPLPPPPRSLPPPRTTLKPSMAVIVGVITTMFSITFLLLLYAKHCRRSNGYPPGGEGMVVAGFERKNSGIDRTIIESLPVFRFGSLSGQKDGLECAVCLNRFDPSEVLRLLPKCKHAFHVECVDTWLDAHSTCPLCRYRVEPEDILLVLDENKISRENDHSREVTEETKGAKEGEEKEVTVRRVSGRHSSAGEKGTALVQISVESSPLPTAAVVGNRRSLDSASCKKKAAKRKEKKRRKNDETPSSSAAVSVGCLDRHRKDGLLLAETAEAAAEAERRRRSFERRFEHRIIVGAGGPHRWSDVQPSDLLYLRSEMIISDSRRLKESRPSVGSNDRTNGWLQKQQRTQHEGGRSVINSRSVSEITGLSRFGSNEQAGIVSRWLAWVSEPKSQPTGLHPGRQSSSSNV